VINAQEKIAQYLYEQGISEAYFDAVHDQNRPILDGERVIANAIIAALPGLVKPLEWEDHPKADGPVLSQAFVQGGGYFICDDTDDFTGLYCEFISCRNATWYGSVTASTDVVFAHYQADDPAPLKAAAQHHHVAQIMAAFGVDGEST